MGKVIPSELLNEWDRVALMFRRSKIDLSRIPLVLEDEEEHIKNERRKAQKRKAKESGVENGKINKKK